MMEATTIPLTIPEMKAADKDFNDYRITDVFPSAPPGNYTLSLKDNTGGCGVFLEARNNPKEVEPKVNDTLRVYGLIGRPIYGMDLNGVEIYWKTPKEREADRAIWLAQIDRENREDYARSREKNEAIVQALPEPLRKRIERFRAEKPGEERLSEGYEIFCCQQAAWLIGVLKPRIESGMSPEAAVAWFKALTPGQQVILGMSDDHSGKTFGGMCALARAVLEGKEV
jgi:DNA-binding transcriptional ArsR family regulator